MERIVILSFDDAVVNQRQFVAPLLLEMGFGATFFPCRWNRKWREKYPGALMEKKALRELWEMGFEVGNHTWGHSRAEQVSTEEYMADVIRMEEYLKMAGLPAPRTFAYPCGTSTPQVVEALKARGYRCARSVENVPFHPQKDDWMRFPAASLQDQSQEEGLLRAMLDQCTPETPVAILYHGVPEIAHPWVNRDPQGFRKDMEMLQKEGVSVLSFQQYWELAAPAQP
ncbi:MAG: polysaccharide deacetylase family protein [Oligosphaeraceae bacterium]